MATMSHLDESLQCAPDSPIHAQDSASLADILTALVEQSGQARNEPTSQIECVRHEVSQLEVSKLRSARDHVHDPLSHSMPVPSMPSGKTRPDISLQDLVEREMKAARELEQTKTSGATVRGGVEKSSQRTSHISQSVAPRGVMTEPGATTERGTTERDGSQWYRVDPREALLKQSYKALEKRDEALKHAAQENLRIAEEKAACVAAHEKEVRQLEYTLKFVMAENKTLKEALALAMGKHPPKLTPPAVPDDIETVMMSSLIHSGLSNIPSTPQSSGSRSTETPPFEPETEEWASLLQLDE